MYPQHEAMSSSTSTALSRRAFGKRGLSALAGVAGIALFGTTAAQEVADERVDVTPRSLASTAADTPVETEAAPVSSGQYIVNFALQFVGYPYVWAGNTPAGFDCSGFTQYVVLNTVGIDIGHGTAGQTGFGTWIGAGELLPGDMVYFAGTFGDGVSHAGIYIGDGLFVHAENEGTGVTVSPLWSDYYAAHYYCATRVW